MDELQRPPLPRFEQTMQRSIDGIKTAVSEMGTLIERALNDSLQSLLANDRRLAYSVILRDRLTDEKEQELNRLCQEFLIRQQPVAGPLRLAYAAIRISLELERMGDYAESIARQSLRIVGIPDAAQRAHYTQMAELTIHMLRDAVKSFVTEDVELAKRTIAVEETVDLLKSEMSQNLVALLRADQAGFETVNPLLQVNRRLERASDQARNICHEVIYMCTGQPTRHPAGGVARVLFVDESNGCLSRMAQALGESLDRPKMAFASAGVDPRSLDTTTTAFLQAKQGYLPRTPPRGIREVLELDRYDVVVALAEKVKKAFPRQQRGFVFLEWLHHRSPVGTEGSPEDVAAAYETAWERLRADVADLAELVDGE